MYIIDKLSSKEEQHMVKRNKQIKVLIDSPHILTSSAIYLIQMFRTKNKLNFDFAIAYDYNMEEYGCYYPGSKGQGKNTVFVNPDLCLDRNNIEDSDKKISCEGYTWDVSLFGIIIHEFCHFLQFQVYKTIVKDFKKEFPTTRLYLNDYCNNELIDEMAEIMTLYIVNPYLLKLISLDHYKFLKLYFKSPIACSKEKCFVIYEGFPQDIKDELETKWNIVYNHHEEDFERVV